MFGYLSMLAFLRYNFRHFNAGSMSGWARGGPLLAQRVESVAPLAMALQRDDESLDHLLPLFEPFESAHGAAAV